MGDFWNDPIHLREDAPAETQEEVFDPRAAEAVLRAALRPDETAVAYAEGLVRVVLQLFENCGVLLTDQRLLLAQRVWVNHWDVTTEFAVGSCEVVADRVRFDASRLLVVRSGEATRCLHFGHRWRDPAGLIAEGLSSRVEFDSYDAEEEAMAVLHDLSSAVLVKK